MQVGEHRVCFVESLLDGERDLVLESFLDWLLSLRARRHCLVFRYFNGVMRSGYNISVVVDCTLNSPRRYRRRLTLWWWLLCSLEVS